MPEAQARIVAEQQAAFINAATRKNLKMSRYSQDCRFVPITPLSFRPACSRQAKVGIQAFGELSGSVFGELSRAAELAEDRAVV